MSRFSRISTWLKRKFSSPENYEELRRLARQRQLILQTTLDGYILADAQGNIVDVNPAYCRMTGYTRAELLQMNINDIEAQLDPAEVAARIQEMLAAGALAFQTKHRAKDGRLLDLDVSIAILDDPAGPLVAAFVRDVTEQNRALNELRQSESRWRTLVDTSPDAITLTDLEGNIIACNRQTAVLHGFANPEELIGLSSLNLIAPEDHERAGQNLFRALQGEVVRDLPYTLLRQDGSAFPGEVSAALISDENGEPEAFIGITRDTSRRVQSQQALRESELRFRSVVEQSQDGIAINNEEGSIIVWNAAMGEITGLLAKDVVGRPIWEVQYELLAAEDQTPARLAQLKEGIRTFLKTGRAPWANQLLERSYTRPDGETLYVQGITFPIQTDKGYMLSSITRDITSIKQAENALRDSEQNYRTLFEEASDAILVLDGQNNVLDANKKASELFGLSHDELLTRNALEFLHEEDIRSKDHETALARLLAGETIHTDYRLRRSDGSFVPAELSTKMLDDNRFLNIIRDLTERLAAEKALRESEDRYRLLVNESPYAIGVHQDGQIVFANPAAVRLFRAKTVDDLLGLSIDQIVSPRTWAAAKARIGRMLQGETGLYPTEDEYIRLDGTKMPVEVTAAPFIFNDKPAVQVIALDITERKKAERELAEALAKWESLVKNAPNFISIVDRDYRLQFLNQLQPGFRLEDVLGMSTLDFVAPEYHEMVRAKIDYVFQTGKATHYELQGEGPHGEPAWYETWVGPLLMDGEIAFVTQISYDISDRKEAEAALQQALAAEQEARRLAETMQAANTALSRTLDLQTVLETLLDYLANLVPYDSANVMLRESETQVKVYAMRGYEKWTDTQATRQIILDARYNPFVAQILASGQSILIADTGQTPGWETKPGAEHVKSWMGIPLVAGGEVLGLYSLDKTEAGFFTPMHLQRVESLTAQGAVALKNIRLFEAEKVQRAVAEGLRDTAVALNKARTLDEVLAALMDNMGRILPHDARDIMLIKNAAAYTVRVDGSLPLDYAAWQKAVVLPLKSTPDLQKIAQSQKPLYIPDIQQDAAWVPFKETAWIRSCITAPIIVQETAVGFISIYSQEPNRFSEKDAQMLEGFADQAAVAMEKTELIATLEQRVAERTAELALRNQELETFTYSVSHDLKAPLRGIDGYSRLLLEEYADLLDEDGRFFVNSVRKATLQMNELIDDLLLYSRLERRTMESGPVYPQAVIDALLAERADEIAERGVVVSVSLPATAVLADRDGLTMALRNLLDNALKFTQETSEPHIEIGGQEAPTSCIIWIKDNGTGFDMKFVDRIFEIFQRLHRAEDFPGTGVGLAIVKKAMDRMNGRVWAESEPGKGAAFFLEIPRTS